MRDFEEALMEEENGIRAGWNEEEQRWYPHESLEGGTPTVAYGHKLTGFENTTGALDVGGVEVDVFKEGLTEQQARQLLRRDIQAAEDYLEKKIPDYHNLPRKYQKVLIAVQFNTGSVSEQSWPRLLRAMRRGRDPVVRLEMVTSYRDPSGRRHRLTRRARKMADAIGLGP